MKYWPPFDNPSDPDAPYVNGNPAVGQQGSIPPAESIEHPMREVVNFIDNSNLEPNAADLEQLTKAVRSGYVNYVEDTGSTNALSGAFDPPLAAYTLGLPINIRAHSTNSGPASVNINNLGGRSIVNGDGSQLSAGEIVDGQVAQLMYDGANFQLLNSAAAGGGGTVEFRIPFAVDTGAVNHLVANFSPAITELFAGLLIEVKALVTNTGASDINVNGLGAKSIVDPDGSVVEAGDIAAGQVLLLIYDGSNFQLSSFIQSTAAAGIPYVNDSGTQNALVGNYAPAITSYTAGLTIEIKAANRNTGNTTINVNGLGIKTIVSPDSQALVDGAFDANAVLLLIYDGTNFQLVNFQSGRGVRFVVDTGTADSLVVAPLPPVLAYRAGLELYVKKKAGSPNSGAMNINVSGLGSRSIYTPYGDPHGAMSWAGDEVGQIVYDGSAFRLMPQRMRKRQMCVLHTITQANLPSGSYSEIVMSAEHDPNGWKAGGNSRITIPVGGLYDVRATIWATQSWTGVTLGKLFDVAFPSNVWGFDAKEMLSSNPGGLFINLIRVLNPGTFTVQWYSSNGSFRWNYAMFSMERID